MRGFKGGLGGPLQGVGEWGAWRGGARPCASWARRRFRPEVGEEGADGWGPPVSERGEGCRARLAVGLCARRVRQVRAGPARLARLAIPFFFLFLFLFLFCFKNLIQISQENILK